MLAKAYSENGVTLHLLPHFNMRFYRIQDEIQKNYSSEATLAAISIDRFCILEALSIAPFVEAPDDSPFRAYFDQRTGLSMTQKFDLFETLFDVEHLNLIYNAWQAGREPVIPLSIPDDIADDETAKKNISSGNGGNNLNTKNAANGHSKSETISASTVTAEPSG